MYFGAGRASMSCLEAVSTLCWCMVMLSPMLVHAPLSRCTSLCYCVPPACTRHIESRIPGRRNCPSVMEQWRAVHPYQGHEKTAASVMQSCISRPHNSVCSTKPGSSSHSLGWPALLGTFSCSSVAPGLCSGISSALQARGNVQTM